MIPLVCRRRLGVIVRYSVSWVFVLAVACASAPVIARAEPGENPPRYHLKVGQRIEYRDVRQSDVEEKRKDTFGLTYWVVGENPDQSWRLLFHHRRDQSWMSGEGPEKARTLHDEYGYFDLFADGRVITCKRGFSLSPELFFLRLPAGPLTGDITWESTSSDGSTKWLFKASPPAAGSPIWSFTARKERQHDAIYQVSAELSQTFDLEHGLVLSATSRLEQGWGVEQTVIGARELIANEQLPKAESRQLSREAAIYFQAVDEIQPLYNAAERDFRHTAELLDRVDAVFARLDGQLELPIFQAILDVERQLRSRERKQRIEPAEKFVRQLDLPSAQWQTTDLDGASHALKEYRGKVVLLDFWYRGCGWCIKAMPQVNQLADDFKDQPVAILGMNNDRDEADARFVIDAMKLTYPTLKNRVVDEGEGIAGQYSIRGFPTLVLIDQQGIVRDFYVGYSPTLRDDLAARIREFLAADKEPAADSTERQP